MINLLPNQLHYYARDQTATETKHYQAERHPIQGSSDRTHTQQLLQPGAGRRNLRLVQLQGLDIFACLALASDTKNAIQLHYVVKWI